MMLKSITRRGALRGRVDPEGELACDELSEPRKRLG